MAYVPGLCIHGQAEMHMCARTLTYGIRAWPGGEHGRLTLTLTLTQTLTLTCLARRRAWEANPDPNPNPNPNPNVPGQVENMGG